MKRMVYIALSILLLVGIAGCVGIPVGSEIISETILGQRTTKEGDVIARIIQIKGVRRHFFLLSPDGGGIHGQSFHMFYWEHNGNRHRLSHLPFAPGRYDVLNPVLPVQGSTKWVAARLSRVESYNVDIELFIFDEKKLYWRVDIAQCIKHYTDTLGWTDLFSYGIEPRNGNTLLSVNTREGKYLYDVKRNILQKY